MLLVHLEKFKVWIFFFFFLVGDKACHESLPSMDFIKRRDYTQFMLNISQLWIFNHIQILNFSFLSVFSAPGDYGRGERKLYSPFSFLNFPHVQILIMAILCISTYLNVSVTNRVEEGCPETFA